MLESMARAEDIVKLYETRLTEKETTSLSIGEVEEYIFTLKVFYTTQYNTIMFMHLLGECDAYKDHLPIAPHPYKYHQWQVQLDPCPFFILSLTGPP